MAADGEALGVITKEEALAAARTAGLDLVEVAPNAKPPVARIMDFGAFRYRQQKQLQQQRKHAKKVEIKGIRIGMRISEHDFSHKVDQAREFLREGHRVKLELVMRGREQAFQLRDRALVKIDGFLKALDLPIIREQKMSKVGNRLTLVVSAGKIPKKPEQTTPAKPVPAKPQ